MLLSNHAQGNIPKDFPRDLLDDGSHDTNPDADSADNLFLDPDMAHERSRILAKLGRADPDAGTLPHDYDYSKHLRTMGGGMYVPAARAETELAQEVLKLRAAPMKVQDEEAFFKSIVVPGMCMCCGVMMGWVGLRWVVSCCVVLCLIF
jgi:hypothetical protein